MRATSASVPWRLAAAMAGSIAALLFLGAAPALITERASAIIVWRRTVGPAFGHSTRAFSDRKAIAAGSSSTSVRIWLTYRSNLSSKRFIPAIAVWHLVHRRRWHVSNRYSASSSLLLKCLYIAGLV